MHYNWNRYYDPASGRYVSADPIGQEDGLNLYVYADGNPLWAFDINGNAAIQISSSCKDNLIDYYYKHGRNDEGYSKLTSTKWFNVDGLYEPIGDKKWRILKVSDSGFINISCDSGEKPNVTWKDPVGELRNKKAKPGWKVGWYPMDGVNTPEEWKEDPTK